MDMSKEGYGPAEIAREIDAPLSTVKGWIYKGKMPPLARWRPKLSKELAYIIGVLHGDGYLYINGRHYKIGLGVEDYEFAEAFSRIMARLLNRKYLLPKWNKSNNVWVVVYCSKAFYTWYKQQSLESLKQFIEYSKDTVAYFLRGLFDSEGNHYKYKKRRSSYIRLYNNDITLLKYVQHLLKKYFGINVTGPYMSVKAGTEHEIRNERIIKTKHDNYSIYISRKQYIQRFLDEIRFGITEKQLGLPRRR